MFNVTFNVKFNVTFNDQQIPDSTFKLCALPAAGDSERLHVHDLQQLGLQVDSAMHNAHCTRVLYINPVGPCQYCWPPPTIGNVYVMYRKATLSRRSPVTQ